ncbi:MAG: hypothetical protein ACKJSG_17745 [Lentisphaeria bacterium]
MRRARPAIIGDEAVRQGQRGMDRQRLQRRRYPWQTITCLSDEYFTLLADHQEIARRRSTLLSMFIARG